MTLRAQLEVARGELLLDVALEAGAGGLVLIGPNGAGKSTLLRALLGDVPVRRGRIAVGDEVLFDDGVDVAIEQRRLGYVPQEYALFPHLSVWGNVAFSGAAAARVDGALRELGLLHLAKRAPRTLSGGEMQRVALARVLVAAPRALLLDEPLAALDVHARHEVREFLRGWLTRVALPSIIVSHDAEDARVLGERVVVLEAGRVTQAGPWEELAARPATPFIEAFFRAR